MPESTHHPSGPLAVAVALAAAAGFVDAHIYVNVAPVFVANMSGNLIHLGILLGDGSWRTAVASLLTLGAFTSGVALATIHHDREVARDRPVGSSVLLATEAVLLLALTVWMAATATHFTTEPRPVAYPVLLVAGVAMGLQASAIRRVGQVAIATTYGTGAIVRIGETVVLAARRANRPTEHRRRVAVAVLLLVLVSYVAGAVAAAAAGTSPLLLAIPTLVTAACALASWKHPEVAPPATAAPIAS